MNIKWVSVVVSLIIGIVVGLSVGYTSRGSPDTGKACQEARVESSASTIHTACNVLSLLQAGSIEQAKRMLGRWVVLTTDVVWVETAGMADGKLAQTTRGTVLSAVGKADRGLLRNELEKSLQVIRRKTLSNTWSEVFIQLDRVE